MGTVIVLTVTHFFLYIYRMNESVINSRDILKFIFDYLVTILSLIILLPVIIMLAMSIKLTGDGPVLYKQKRIGRHGKSFDIYKFRTMYSENDEGRILLSDRNDKRITRLGRFMRKHKFDEIPNFINVLKGDMSIIGPRPEQQFFIDKILEIDQRYQYLQRIKPGITSWGQVKYGYASNVQEMIKRMEYDLFYLDNRSVRFNLKITLCTLGIILKGKGI
jgi:lipopolysaccharide/colanic/teichoic acid biosynthesis glycosyltransferase